MLKAMKKRDKIMTFFVGDNYKSLLNPFVEPNATFFHLSATSLLGQYGWYSVSDFYKTIICTGIIRNHVELQASSSENVCF